MSDSLVSTMRGNRCSTLKALGAVLMVVVLAFYNVWAVQAAEADAWARQQIADATHVGQGPYATDGVFVGSAEGYGGLVTTQVTVEDGWITSVEILDASHEDQAWLDMAAVLPQRIIEAQTPSIDVVSGATFTSLGILNGATEALLESMAGGSSAQDASAQDVDGKSAESATADSSVASSEVPTEGEAV